MILKQFRQYTIDGVNYTSHADIQKSLNLTRDQVYARKRKDPNWLKIVKGPVGVVYKNPTKVYLYIVDNQVYDTLDEIGQLFNMSREAVRKRMANPNFPTWKSFYGKYIEKDLFRKFKKPLKTVDF